jgi:signal transduction histidine kinase
MTEEKTKTSGESDYRSMRTIRQSMKVIFSCLTAIPFFVFAFIFMNIGGSFSTALTGGLITLALVLILEGFIIFRKMAEHIERISSDMAGIETGSVDKIKKEGETRELAVIADTFNRTLDKLEDTAKQLSTKVAQVSTLNEIGEAVSKTINIDEIAGLVLEKSIDESGSRAGYLAVKQGSSPVYKAAAVMGVELDTILDINLELGNTVANRAIEKRSPVQIQDTELADTTKGLNVPDIGRRRVLYLPILVKGAAIGLLAIGKDIDQSPYDEEDIMFLQTMLRHAGAGIENARLYEDIQRTNRKLAEALVSQQKAQAHLLTSARMTAFGELSVNVAHELNNPLTGILGYTELLLSSPMDENEKSRCLEDIKGQAARASNIIRGLLDFADEKSGIADADLNSMIEKVIMLAKGRMDAEGIRLDMDLAEALPSVNVNRNEMEQVFLNLINNAVNALSGEYQAVSCDKSVNGRCLKIRTERKSEKILASFQDNGSGISPDDLPRIFEPFFSTKRDVSQVGLGLWISHRIVRANGGAIKVKSKPGEGSAFFVILPITKHDVSVANT